MAKQTDGILGGFNGKVGTVVGYRWKGIWCVRSHNALARNPRTEAQQAHRAMFKAEVQLAGKMRWAVNVGLKLPADEMNMTAQNLFVKGNQHAFSSVDGFFKVDYAALQVSCGPVAPVAMTEASVDEDNVLNIKFEKNPLHRSCDSHDSIFFWIFSEELQEGYLSNPVYRRMQKAAVALPDEFQGTTLHVYAFAQDEQGRCSETGYAEAGISGISGISGEAGISGVSEASGISGEAGIAQTIDPETGEILSASPLETGSGERGDLPPEENFFLEK